MNRRIFIRNLGIGTAGLSLGMPLTTLAADDFKVLSILHTNDIHSHVEPFSGTNPNYDGKGGLARISGMIKNIKEKNPDTLVFDAGDAFQGTPYFNFFGGELIYELMSAAGYDASAIGNHEFDNGLQGLLNALETAKFPLINSNYDFSDTILAGKFPRYKIYRKSGIKVGVYGIGIELNGLVAPLQYGNTVFLEPVKTAVQMENYLKNERKCDLVICLSHLGLRYRDNQVSDMTLASETSYTDLIIGGHTHTFLKEPLTLKNKAGSPVLVNQAWWGGLVLGHIDFVFERISKKRTKTIASNNL
jgi:5'-nucleotidase